MKHIIIIGALIALVFLMPDRMSESLFLQGIRLLLIGIMIVLWLYWKSSE